MPTTSRCPIRVPVERVPVQRVPVQRATARFAGVLCAAALLAITAALMPAQAMAEGMVTIEPGFESELIHTVQPVDFETEERTISVHEIAETSPATPFSLGDYSHLPAVEAPGSGDKAVEVLNADFNVTSGAVNHSEPDVAYNSTNGDYLVVYVRHSGGATGTDIYGQRVSAAGVPTGSPFAIMAEPENESRPRVIYNPVSNEFMVAAYLTNGVSHLAITRVVPATGVPTAMIFDPFALFTDANSPDVAYNAASAEYLVVSGRISQDSIIMRRLAVGHGTPQGVELQFRESDGVLDAAPSIIAYPTTGEYVIFSERINGALRGIYGYKLPAAVNTVSVLTGFTVGVNSYVPRIAADTGRGEIFVTWQMATDATDTAFNTVFGPVNFTSGTVGTIGAASSSSTDDRRPRVAYQSTEDDFLITWSQAGAVSQPVAAFTGGTTSGVVQSGTSSAPTTTADASIAVNGSESLQVWTENSVPSQIRGRLLGTAAPSLSVNPTSLDFGTSTVTLPVTLTNTGTGSLLWGTTAPIWVVRVPGTSSFFTSQNITIGVNRAGFAPGTYNTTLTFLVPAATDVTVPVTMTVPNTPPTAPANPSPANGATNQPLAFTLDWTSSDPDVGQVVTHDLYLSTSQALVNTLDPTVRLASDFTNSEAGVSGLGNLTTYYWRIVAKDGVTTTAGPTWSFSTARVGMTTLTPMADPTNDSTPTFQWSAVAGAGSYDLRVATDPEFSNFAFIVPGIAGTSYTPTTPLGDNQYFWTVITVAPNGTESFQPSADSFTIDTMPPAVPTLSAVSSPTSNARPVLSWSASAGASSYALQAATDAAFTNLVINQTQSGTSFTPTSDLPEGTIHWRVAANDAAGNQSAFASGTFEIDQTAPAVPVLIAAPDPTGDPRQAMSWNASAGASTYRIQVSTDAAFATTLFDQAGLATTSFTPTSDLPEGTIYWRVLATDPAANASVFSAADSFDVDLTAPAVPTLNAVLPDPTNNQRPELTWTAVAGATDYALQVSSAAFLHGGSQAEGSLLFNGIVAGTSWTSEKADLPEGPIYWRLASRDDVGNQSAFSAADDFTIDVTPPDVPTLTPVSDPTADATPQLSWSAVTDAVAYRVQVSTDSGFATTLHDVSIAATSFTPGSALPETTIYWRVASRDVADNDSAFSAANSFDLDLTPPGVPTQIAVTPDPTNNRRPTMSWNAVSGASEYRFTLSVTGALGVAIDTTVSGTSYTPTFDLPEGGIVWHVASRDALGNESAFSSGDTFTIDITPPGVPTLIAVTPDPTNNQRPTMSWNAVAGAAEYRLVLTSGGSLGALINTTVTGTSYTPTIDLPEGVIAWNVASRDALGNESAFSSGETFTIDITPPGVPTLVAVTPDPTSNRRPTMTWNAVSGASEYRFVLSSTGAVGNLIDTTVSGTSYTPTIDLPEGGIVWQVASRDGLGNESALSSSDSFTIDITAPAVPTLTPVSPDPTANPRPTLSWGAVSGAADYRVQVSTDAGFGSTLFDLTVAGSSWTPTSDLPEGTVYWRASSRDALGNESAFAAADDFEIDVSAPAVPTLTPVSPDPTANPRPTLSWGAVSGAADCRVQVSTDAGFGTTLFDLNVVGTSWTPSSDLPEGTVYWRASSRDALGNESAFAPADDFVIDITGPAAPVLTPVTPDPTANPRPTLSWGAVSGAADYRVQVSTDAGFGTTLFDLTVAGTSWTPSSDLPEGTVYWRASSRDALGNESAFAPADDFVIDITGPAAPVLTPVTPDPTQDLRPTLVWSSVADAPLYHLQVSTDAGFASTIVDTILPVTSFTPAADLPEGQIFWRVSSRDAFGNEGAFSAVDDFVTDVTAPAAVVGLTSTWDDVSSWTLRWQPSPEADFAHYAIYREAAPFTDTTGLTPIDTSITDPAQSQFVDPSPLPGQDGHYAVVAVDAAGNALSTVESIAAPGPSPIFADGFESGDLSNWSLVSP